MSTFIRPTLTEILSAIESDIDSRLTDSDATLRYSVLSVIAYVLAGVANGEYGFISWLALQIFPDTAESDYLRRWGSFWGVTPVAATPASGNLDVTGVSDGAVIPISTEFIRSDGVLYESTEEVTIASGIASVPIVAQVTGETTDADTDTVLTFVSPIATISTTGTVDSDGLIGGADDEEDEPFLQRLLDRIQNPPQGGSQKDYIKWTLEVANVSRAWCYPSELGIGTVTVRFMMDGTYSDGIPLSGDVTTVQNYIDDLRPVTADVTVVAPVAVPLNFTIELVGAEDDDIKTAIEANLREMIANDGQPSGTIYLSRINEAISLAAGEFDHILTVPAANVTHTTGQIPTMGTITWV